jgi:UDP-2-acetamido-3-amino-2,3-dideoxy-glucuronate N-acetyltransferase
MSTNNVFIHPSAFVDEGAKLGNNTKVWHFSHVSPEAVIGSDCSLGQNVYVGNKVLIGNNVKIQNNVSIYDNVYLEDNVFCGPSMVFTNVKNPRSEIVRKHEYARTIVRKGSTLGANCTVVCGIEIGQYAFIAAGAVVAKNVKPFALIVGVPGVQVGWMSRFGEKIPLPLNGSGVYICPHLNDEYTLIENDLHCKIKENN